VVDAGPLFCLWTGFCTVSELHAEENTYINESQ
jgi:hypothetical protein